MQNKKATNFLLSAYNWLQIRRPLMTAEVPSELEKDFRQKLETASWGNAGEKEMMLRWTAAASLVFCSKGSMQHGSKGSTQHGSN
mgnify:CR=1 FL=1